jgi:type I restriction enzyme S subunit
MPAGTVLFTSRAPIGYVAIASNPICTNQGFKSFVLREEVLPDYVYWWLKGSKRLAESMASGTTFLELSGAKAKQLPIPIAPGDEQKRIVAEIEKQFSRLDEAVTNLNRVKANLKRYKAAVLKAAVEGRLVETEAEIARREGRTYETGEQLLQRILKTHRSEWKGRGKYKEPTTPDTSYLPELPEGWVCASVDQLVAHLTDGDHQPPPQTEQGVPFLVIGNVRNGEIDFSDTRHVGHAYYESLDPNRKPKQGDLLYTLVGSYGIAVRVKTDNPFCIQRHMAILRPHKNSPMEYLTLAMASDTVFKQATAVATGTAQKTVPLAGLRSIAIPLPPLAEHARIVDEVGRHSSLINETEVQVDVNLRRSNRLRQSILEKAFSGLLISGDSNAKPASELLAPIRPESETEKEQVTEAPQAHASKPVRMEVAVADLVEALKSAGGWISAQDTFRRCGVADGADTDKIERMYAELRDFIQTEAIEVERRGAEDWLRLSQSKEA